MTSIDFLNKVHKSLDSQEYSLSYSPAKSKNYMLYCNGNFIGGLFDEELCFVYADSVSELLGQPEPVYCGYSSTAQHRMLGDPGGTLGEGAETALCRENLTGAGWCTTSHTPALARLWWRTSTTRMWCFCASALKRNC